MKRLILAILPVLLASQIPLSVTKFVPSDWKKNFDFGLKWTGLLLDSYSSDSDSEFESDSVPEGIVTTTVVLASIPEFEQEFQMVIDQEMCQAQLEIAKEIAKRVKIQKEFKKYRIIEINGNTIQL